jgi:hypothetical protein
MDVEVFGRADELKNEATQRVGKKGLFVPSERRFFVYYIDSLSTTKHPILGGEGGKGKGV